VLSQAASSPGASTASGSPNPVKPEPVIALAPAPDKYRDQLGRRGYTNLDLDVASPVFRSSAGTYSSMTVMHRTVATTSAGLSSAAAAAARSVPAVTMTPAACNGHPEAARTSRTAAVVVPAPAAAPVIKRVRKDHTIQLNTPGCIIPPQTTHFRLATDAAPADKLLAGSGGAAARRFVRHLPLRTAEDQWIVLSVVPEDVEEAIGTSKPARSAWVAADAAPASGGGGRGNASVNVGMGIGGSLQGRMLTATGTGGVAGGGSSGGGSGAGGSGTAYAGSHSAARRVGRAGGEPIGGVGSSAGVEASWHAPAPSVPSRLGYSGYAAAQRRGAVGGAGGAGGASSRGRRGRGRPPRSRGGASRLAPRGGVVRYVSSAASPRQDSGTVSDAEESRGGDDDRDSGMIQELDDDDASRSGSYGYAGTPDEDGEGWAAGATGGAGMDVDEEAGDAPGDGDDDEHFGRGSDQHRGTSSPQSGDDPLGGLASLLHVASQHAHHRDPQGRGASASHGNYQRRV
jgi:hypothetical protein